MDTHNNNTKSTEAWMSGMEDFESFYAQYHPSLAIGTCIFGIITNLVNIIVLTRKNMRNSVNFLLSALSLAQLALLINYVILQLFVHFRKQAKSRCDPDAFTTSHVGSMYLWLNVNMNVYLHSVAFGLTLCMALFRYIILKWPFSSKTWLRQDMAMKWSVSTAMLILLLCTPIFASSEPKAYNFTCLHPNKSSYSSNTLSSSEEDQEMELQDQHREWDLAYTSNTELLMAGFWINSVVLKLFPCCVMIVLITGLIASMRKVEKQKSRLLGGVGVIRGGGGVGGGLRSHSTTTTFNNNYLTAAKTTISTAAYASPELSVQSISMDFQQENEKEKEDGGRIRRRHSHQAGGRHNRHHHHRSKTTRMLVVVVILCVAVEMPHAIINIFVGIWGAEFGEQFYDRIGDLIELLTLLYSSINFIVYCTMSTLFRSTFVTVFINRFALTRQLSEYWSRLMDRLYFLSTTRRRPSLALKSSNNNAQKAMSAGTSSTTTAAKKETKDATQTSTGPIFSGQAATLQP